MYFTFALDKEANGIEVPKQGKGKKSSIIKESDAEELKQLRKENISF